MVGIRSKTKVTRAVIEARPELKAIGAFCIGTNQIDLDAAAAHGVAAFNAPYSNTRSVVELVIGEIIARLLSGEATLPVAGTFGLDEVADAVAATLTDGRQGKVLLRP